MKVNLNKREEHVLNSIMKPMQSILQPNSPVYYDMAVKMIHTQLFGGGTLVTTKGCRTMLLSICEKIAHAHMDSEIENILSEAAEIEVEMKSTRAESMKVSKTNSSKGHILIRAALQTAQEPLSRSDLANLTNLRVSAVCARVKELIDEGSVRVSGTKWDSESERNVETLVLA